MDNATVVDVPDRVVGDGTYQKGRTEDLVFTEGLVGLVPLKLIWHPGHSDFASVATKESEQEFLAAGYQLVRIEAYVYAQGVPGTLPLKTVSAC